MSGRWTTDLLDQLREIGDPHLDERRNGALKEALKAGRKDLSGDETPTVLGDIARASFFRVPISEEDRVAQESEFWRADHADWSGRWSVEHKAHYWDRAPAWQSRLSPEDVATAQGLFVRFGQEIGASLLLASLPHSYAAESGAYFLAQTDQLGSHFDRRIAATAQFLLDVMITEDPGRRHRGHDVARKVRTAGYEIDPRLTLLPGGRGFIAARRTRLVHSIIRWHLADLEKKRTFRPPKEIGGLPLGTPINQEHLLGTYLSFCVTVWQSLERLGVRWTQQEKSAYFRVWDWIAHLMGIGDRRAIDKRLTGDAASLLRGFGEDEPVRPSTVEEAEELLAMIRDRNWPAPQETGAFQNANGKRLVRTLLDELEDAMPALFQPVPATVMRYLSDERAQVALGLGGGGLPPLLADWADNRSRDWNRRPTPLTAPAMRFAANQVCLHAFSTFVRQEGFRFPGIDDLGLTLTTQSRKKSKEQTAKAQERIDRVMAPSDPQARVDAARRAAVAAEKAVEAAEAAAADARNERDAAEAELQRVQGGPGGP